MIQYIVKLYLNDKGKELFETDTKEIKINSPVQVNYGGDLAELINDKCPSELYSQYSVHTVKKICEGDIVNFTVTSDNGMFRMAFVGPVVEVNENNHTFKVQLLDRVVDCILENFNRKQSDWFLTHSTITFNMLENDGGFTQITRKKNKITARLATNYEIESYQQMKKKEALISEISSFFSDEFCFDIYDHSIEELCDFLTHLKKFLRVEENKIV